MKCNCSDWKENIAQVNGPFLLQSARSGHDGSVSYKGKIFEFCPWCSSKLLEDEPTPKHIPHHEIAHVWAKRLCFTLWEEGGEYALGDPRYTRFFKVRSAILSALEEKASK